jgi:hypothetical protein
MGANAEPPTEPFEDEDDDELLRNSSTLGG